MSQSHDDDGIIDLTALSSPRRAAPGAVFQSEPPPAAFARDAGSSVASSVYTPASREIRSFSAWRPN